MNLSEETRENLLVALAQATDDQGVPVCIRPEDAFTALILDQTPSANKYFLELPANG